ncbi:SH3-containing GRB2-like protein 3-interacting protein 1 isoform X3 [Catharus ustulatus]|uniref:SH3-containing GRB2-like protein 3-interacting protein 1 isoform X3 n=1 Tax=Catharus ustulatus TaxID=91951 RepID=UPI00140ACE0D|nr:SH3-containing GRB2-like protein 3-interacting protein 1 isoform X3 [Catharus ustulatus]
MMEGLKKRTRKAFGIRKKEKDTDSTGSPDRDGIKKTNGAPNGFYAEIDWDRYNSPELDEEGYSIRPEEPGSTKGKHFYSSSESEEEEEAHKKFNIKIKPLQAKDALRSAATVDELRASVGNIALSPSPVRKSPRRSPGTIKRNLSSEEISRPRRSTPTPDPARKPPEDTAALAPLFGPPLESAFEEQKLEAALDQPEIWGSAQPINTNVESPKLPRPFPTGTPPPLPPKNIPATPPRTGSPLPLAIGGDQAAAEPKRDKLPSINDLDSIFGPVPSPKSAAATAEDKWVNFSDQSPENAAPELSPQEKASPAEPPRPLPSPLQLEDAPKKLPEHPHLKDELTEPVASPKELGPGQRATPPPPPPPTYRAVVSSPGPGASTGSASGSSSPARPGTPLATCGTPPPPPPRPPSRPKLPPGKPPVSDVSRPFSPPIHSSSPPPIAPLARAESTSSISSTNSLSAATTPTVGSSRGPSPLTMGAQDTLPVAAAFTETVNAYFKGADPNKCIVKITGEMVLSFPAGITRHFATNPAPAVLTFRVLNFNRLEHVLPNPQLLCCDNVQSDSNSKEFWVNMPNLMTHLKKVSEQKPQATYYNVDMLKYQVSAQGIQSTPLNLAVSWRCDPASTDLRIDYKYNTEAMTAPVALNNVQFLVPVDGGVTKLQAVLPPAVWNAEQQRILWKIPDISQKSENGGVGSLLARFQLAEGPSSPAPLAVQFTSEGSTLSSCDIELVGPGYRFSLIKKRFAAGKYLADN